MTGSRGRDSRLKRFAPLGNDFVANCCEGEKICGKDIKDDKIDQSACKEDEISKLRELNQVLLEEIQISRKEKAHLSQKFAQIESQNNELEAVKRNFQSEMDDLYGGLVEQGKLREELRKRLKESEEDTDELKEQLKDLLPHHIVPRHSIQEELDSTRRLLEIQIKRVEEQTVENGRLKKQVEELSRLSGELEKKNLELLKDNEQEGKIIESLQEENASLGNEKSLLLRNLDEVTRRSEEISKKCLESNLRMLELETQSWLFHTELAVAKSAYVEVTVQLNKIKEDMDKLSHDSYQIQEEKEALDEKLMLQLCRNKALEEELLSVRSSFEEMKESASKCKHPIANLQSQLLVAVEEKDNQIPGIQTQLSTIEEGKRSQLADLHNQLSIVTEAKKYPEEKNTELEERTPVYERQQVCFNGSLRKLETTLYSLNKNFESSRAMRVEKEGYLADLHYHVSDLAEADKGIGQRSFKNNCSLTEMNKCTIVSKTSEWDSVLDSLNKDPESRDIQLQHLKSEGQALQLHVPAENGKPNAVPEKPKPNGVPGNGKPNSVNEKPNGVHGNRKQNSVNVKPKLNGVHGNEKPNVKQNGMHKNRTPRQMSEKQKPKKWSP